MSNSRVIIVVLSVLIKSLLSNPAGSLDHEAGKFGGDDGDDVKPRLTLLCFGSDIDVQPTGCCDWPSCYDERTELCLDTCLMSWSQCPRKLFLMSCYSEYMSPFGALPLQCYPDSGPHVEEAETLGLGGTTREVGQCRQSEI